MTTKAIRKKAVELLEQTDEQFLKIIFSLLQDHAEKNVTSDDEFVLSNADLKEIEKRRMAMRSGKDKGIEGGEFIRQVKTEFKKRHK